MSNGPIKITQLPVATTTNPTQDLMIIVQNTAGTNTTYSITPSVLLAQTAYYTANNANYLGGVAAASYQLNSTLAANIASYLPTYAGVVNASTYTVGSFFLANSTATYIGNTSANVQISGLNVAGTPSALAGFGSSNSSVDIVITNANNGVNASSDFAAYDNNGLVGNNFIDMGISSSTFSESFWTINGPSDGYLYTGNTNLSIGVAALGGGTTNYINFFANGTLITNEVMKITATKVNIGNQAAGAVSLTVGNGSVNAVINSTTVVTSIVNATTNVSTVTVYASNAAVYASANVVINSSGVAVANATGSLLVSTIGTTQGFSANAALVTLGNNTVNTQINATHFFTGNSTNYGFGNSTYEALVTAAGGVNTSVYLINSSSANVGNSTVYGFGNSTVEGLYNTVANTSGVLTASNLSIGNSTSNVTINSTVVAIGSATSAANGASYLPNGLKLNWGWVSASSSAGAVTFTSPYTTNAWVVIATSNTAVATYGAAVTAWTKTGATILTANAAATNVFWQAIGT